MRFVIFAFFLNQQLTHNFCYYSCGIGFSQIYRAQIRRKSNLFPFGNLFIYKQKR